MTTSQIVDYLNLLRFPDVQILKTKQYVQAMPFCMYFRKHSCFERPFNEQLNLYSSSGLIYQWARQFSKPSVKDDEMEPKPLSLNQIAGVLVICMALIATSIIVFIFELISNCHGTVKKMMDFLTYKPNGTSRHRLTCFHRNHYVNVH